MAEQRNHQTNLVSTPTSSIPSHQVLHEKIMFFKIVYKYIRIYLYTILAKLVVSLPPRGLAESIRVNLCNPWLETSLYTKQIILYNIYLTS